MGGEINLFNKKKEGAEPEKKPAAGGGLFGSKKPVGTPIDVQALSNDVVSLSTRVRIIEERYDNLRRKSQVTDQNMIQNHKKLVIENKSIQSTLTELSREINELKDKMKIIIKEISESARKEDITVLQKYINFWEPVNFVTRKEVSSLIRDELEQRDDGKSKKYI